MAVAPIVISSLLAVLISYSAVLKLTHRPTVMEDYRRAGVPEPWLNWLAALLLTAAVGLAVGNWWPLAGVAAAAGLVAYFALAVGFHIRAKDTKNAATPAVLMLLAVAALGLGLTAL
jgi:hypothetical protein